MPIEILMPALSPTMETGNLVKWYKKPGDHVEAGEILAEIETDKATMEIEAVDEGILKKILVESGSQNIKVNSVIALLLEEGEDDSILENYQISTPLSTKESQNQEENKKHTNLSSEEKVFIKSAPSIQPHATSPIPSRQTQELRSNMPDSRRIKASPLARRIAKEKGIDLRNIKGTGPYGRIIKRDLTEGLTRQTDSKSMLPKQETFNVIPLTGIRRIVAQRLSESFRDVPHFPLNVEIGLDRLLSLRKEFNEVQPVRVSINDFIIRASALALRQVPQANASFTEEGIILYNYAHIAVAVAIEGGLVTPVIRHADYKSLPEISTEMKQLAEKAKNRKLLPEDYQGGTFSVSNLGMYNIKSFGSILNPPQGMILSVGKGEKRPVIVENDQIEIKTMMSVTLTCDHRVVDGAIGAQWLSAFRAFIEAPLKLIL